MRKLLSVIVFLPFVILAPFTACGVKEGSFANPAILKNSELPPVVLSVKATKQLKLSGEEGEYLFMVRFSKPMDRESVEDALHIFRVVGNITHGVNIIRGDMEVVKPSRDQRFSWDSEDRVVMIKADLQENSLYFLYIASSAMDKEGIRLDGKVGRDINGDGKADIFPLAQGELVTTINDYMWGPADFWSQPFLAGDLKNLDAFYYALPTSAEFYINKVKELEYVEEIPGRGEYKYMGNLISAKDNSFSFSWPVKINSLLEIDFASDRTYSRRREYWLKSPPLLLDPSTLTSKNIKVYDENYNFLTDARLVYNTHYGKFVGVPLIGKVKLFPTINPSIVNPGMDYYVEVDFGKNIPSHTLGGTYLVIEDDDTGLKYILPVTDNVGDKLKIPVLYAMVRGRRSKTTSNLYYIDNDIFSPGELDGMLAYSVFVHKDDEVYRVQNNRAVSLIVARVSGNGNNIMDCTDFSNEYCSIFIFFDGAKKNLIGKKAYITSNKFYLSIPSLEKGKRYFVMVGGGTESTAVKDIWGIEISDRDYDGTYPDGSGMPDNTVVFSFATRNRTILSYPPTMRINDGTLYPYAVSGDNCNMGVCFDPASFVNETLSCNGKQITVRGFTSIHFSFYTPDGDAGSVYGYNDFLVKSTVNNKNIVLKRNGVPIPEEIKIETVLGRYDPTTPGKGGFPTSLVKVTLPPKIVKCGEKYLTIPNVFHRGDVLIIGHLIEALTSNEKRKFDGNGDGLLEYSAVDDLRLEYNGKRFVHP